MLIALMTAKWKSWHYMQSWPT